MGTATITPNELASAIKSKIDVDNLDKDFLIDYFKKHIQPNSKTQTWNVKIKSFDSFKEDDQKHSRHHGIIPFLIVHFELIPSNGNVLEPFIFNYNAIIHEGVTHDVDIFQTSKNKTEKSKLGRITLDVKTGTFSPVKIQLQREHQKNNSWWIVLLVGIIILAALLYKWRKK